MKKVSLRNFLPVVVWGGRFHTSTGVHRQEISMRRVMFLGVPTFWWVIGGLCLLTLLASFGRGQGPWQ